MALPSSAKCQIHPGDDLGALHTMWTNSVEVHSFPWHDYALLDRHPRCPSVYTCTGTLSSQHQHFAFA